MKRRTVSKETGPSRLTYAERKHLRGLFEEWKAARGLTNGWGSRAVDMDGALNSSLHDLLVVNGYSYTDVAEWLGLSRERVRVLANRGGIYAPGAAMRTWDDADRRFVAVTATEMTRLRWVHKKAAARIDRLHRDALRWDRCIRAIRDLNDDMGRPPKVSEVAESLLGRSDCGALHGHLEPRTPRVPFAEVIPMLYAHAGVERVDYRTVDADAGNQGGERG